MTEILTCLDELDCPVQEAVLTHCNDNVPAVRLLIHLSLSPTRCDLTPGHVPAGSEAEI